MPPLDLIGFGPAPEPAWSSMSVQHPERLPAGNRLRAGRDHAAVKTAGVAVEASGAAALRLARERFDRDVLADQLLSVLQRTVSGGRGVA